MTMSAAASGIPGANDDAVPEILVARAERLVTQMQREVDAQAWTGLPVLADQLHDSLLRLEHSAHGVAAKDAARGAALATRLAEVADRHAALLVALTVARDRTATELSSALQGHGGAVQYLNAAGGS